MKSGQLTRLLALVWLAWGLSFPAAADSQPTITELTNVDREYMNQQRAAIDDLAGRNFGGRISGDTVHDLNVLQRLLETGAVQADQTLELQAMGIVLGDLLAADLDLHWVIYRDNVGRSRALRYRQSDEYLFPATMISRRREADNRKSVADIYQKAYDIMAARKPALPFQ
jgi:hypothetical protein